MNFSGVQRFRILDLGLSQIYLNRAKIDAIEKWLNPEDLSAFQPLPVHDFGDGRYTLTDGHSRAWAAYKAGMTHIPIVYDTDELVAGDEGQMLYRADIEWCDRFRLRNICDLRSRIVAPDVYRRLWLARCDRSHHLLAHTTEDERRSLQAKASGLFLYGASEDLAALYFENASGDLFVYEAGALRPEK